MFAHVSLWGIALSVVAAMVIGGVWYSPVMFGARWMKAISLTNEAMKARTKSALVVLVAVYTLTAYALSLFTAYFHAYNGGSGLKDGLITSLLVWLGFGVTTILAHGVFEPRDRSVLYVNISNRFATLVAMGLIVGAFF
ncbi:MAG TPA: DUF1761 domain-containing protein [Candidatus Chromulinivoraceae bacterium]|nr:DUF1761 domain-containing protein [Candidatus Chromulinivoraceae bacterium]